MRGTVRQRVQQGQYIYGDSAGVVCHHPGGVSCLRVSTALGRMHMQARERALQLSDVALM